MSRYFSAPLWLSGFRPFFLLACAYAPVAMGWLALAQAGEIGVPWPDVLPLWHGHEMVFGFAGAVIAGVLLTALPSWADASEISGARLALLACVWIAGRVAVLLAPWLPPAVVIAADTALFPCIGLMLAPSLLRAAKKRYLGALVILALLFAANLNFHLLVAAPGGGEAALRSAVDVLVLLYTLAGGIFISNFTANALRDMARGEPSPGPMPVPAGELAGFSRPAAVQAVEAVAIASVLVYVVTDQLALAAEWRAAIAALAFAANAVRLACWQGWKILGQPLLWTLHLGYSWMVAAFALRAAADLGLLPATVALHAFTAGALGITMLGLMTRVALRHTGRELQVSTLNLVAYALVSLGALLRVAVHAAGAGAGFYAVAAMLWGASFAIYLVSHAGMLLGPSLPRETLPQQRR